MTIQEVKVYSHAFEHKGYRYTYLTNALTPHEQLEIRLDIVKLERKLKCRFTSCNSTTQLGLSSVQPHHVGVTAVHPATHTCSYSYVH